MDSVPWLKVPWDPPIISPLTQETSYLTDPEARNVLLWQYFHVDPIDPRHSRNNTNLKPRHRFTHVQLSLCHFMLHSGNGMKCLKGLMIRFDFQFYPPERFLDKFNCCFTKAPFYTEGLSKQCGFNWHKRNQKLKENSCMLLGKDGRFESETWLNWSSFCLWFENNTN